MLIQTKEIYKCEHCNKLYQIKRFCESHELSCNKNPANQRACFRCVHLGKKNHTLYNDHPMGGETTRVVSLLHCKHFGNFLYPPKVEHKKNYHETDEIENSPMPMVCNGFTQETFEDLF